MALVVVLGTLSSHVVRVVFVDGAVAEVHAGVPQVTPTAIVGNRGKPRQTLLVEVDHQRVVGGDQDVQSQVRLVAIY